MASTFKLVFTESATKDVAKLDSVTKKRLGKKLREIINLPDPMQVTKPLHSSSIGQYRFRIGHYRVVFDCEGYNLVVLRIRLRSEVYKNH